MKKSHIRIRPLNRVVLSIFTLLCCAAAPAQQQAQQQSDTLQALKPYYERIAAESQSQNHPAVEQTLDQLIQKMLDAGIQPAIVSQEVQKRIEYSMNHNRFQAAYQTATEWLNAFPDDLEVTVLLGKTATYMHRMLEARQAFQTVYESDPDNTVHQKRYLNALIQLNDREPALTLCRDILQPPSSEVQLQIQAVNGLTGFEEYDEALQAAETLPEFQHKAAFITYIQARRFMHQQAYAEAYDAFQQIGSSTPWSSESQAQVSVCLMQLRRFEDAARHNLRLLAKNPYNQNACVNLAQSLARLRKSEPAKLVLSIQKRLESDNMPENEAEYYWNLGNMAAFARLRAITLNAQYRFRSAEQLLLQVTRILPESVEAKINLGKHYFTTLQSNRAETLFRSLLPLTHAEQKQQVQRFLAEALLRQNKPDEVIEWVSAANSHTEQDRQLRSLLGSYYLEFLDDPQQAHRYFQPISNATFSVSAAKAKCLVQLNQPQKALEIFDSLPESHLEPDHQLAKVEALIQLQHHQQAQLLFQSVLRQHPRLSPLYTVPVQVQLAQAFQQEDALELKQRAHEIQQIKQAIQQQVFQAQRAGLPESIPHLQSISNDYEQIGDPTHALLYARRVYDADPQNPQALTRVIRLMNDEQDIFERYHLIYRASRYSDMRDSFSDQLQAIFSTLELPIPADPWGD